MVKFPKEQLLEWGLPRDGGSAKYDVDIISDTICGTSRWSVQHELIFRKGTVFYRTEYSRGATECQEEGPWEYKEEVECEQVRPVEKIIQAWEPV